MTNQSIDAMRVLTSIAASKDLPDATKERALNIISNMMEVIEKEVSIEKKQIVDFAAQLNSGIVTTTGGL